jgi:choline dehydrogenase-like flavoprotein
VTAGTPAALSALVDTFLPAAPPYPAGSEAGVDRELAAFIEGLPRGQRQELASLFRALDSRIANFLLTGAPRRFSNLDPAARERYLVVWSRSRIAIKRKGFQAAKRLATWLYFSKPLVDRTHPLWERIHYDPSELPSGVPDPMESLSPWVPDRDAELDADACIVGSGAGGAVIAERLARAGFRVVVLESGEWFSHLAYPRIEREASDRLLLGRGIVTTRDSAIAFLAGQVAGGSTTVNWMTCLPPRAEARAEWVAEGGLEGADGFEFDQALAGVAKRLEISTAESWVNPSNDALRRGCRALGYSEGSDWGIIPRNAVGCERRCGSCTFGCPYDARRSVLTTYLRDAMRSGARLLCSTHAERVEVETGRAKAVVANYSGGTRPVRVRVRARAVILAAGALETPGLLLRSGLRSPAIGLGLRIDPTTALVGEFPEPVRTWEGPPQTVGVYRFQTSDPGAHGPWIEVAPVHPGLAALAVPWAGSADYRRLLERTEFVATPIVLVRDVAEGRVGIDSDGRPTYEYRLDRRDRQNLVRGLVETARILQAAGATRLLSLHTPYLEAGNGRRPVSRAELDTFVDEIERRGIREHSIALFSAHPMGSARAGRDPTRSTARPTGEVHGIDGLWIGDGSLLPSAPGANPMLSILALATRTAEHVAASLGEGARAA